MFEGFTLLTVASDIVHLVAVAGAHLAAVDRARSAKSNSRSPG